MRLKAEIRELEGLGCSVGIGPNKLIAKIASGHQKPDGLTVIPRENVENFLDPLPLRVIPGIGPKSEHFLHERNLRTVADLRQVPNSTLIEWFGKWGERLFEKARGIDESEVSNEWTRKSLGEQETFDEDTRSQPLVTERLDRMAERIITKLRGKEFKGFRTVTVTVRFNDFQTSNRSRTVKDGIRLDNDDALRRLKEEALSLILPFFDARENPRGKAFRLIGLRVEKLYLRLRIRSFPTHPRNLYPSSLILYPLLMALLKIATWNVNGIRAREAQVLDWVERERPDVICLQELKSTVAQVPAALCELQGYRCYWHGARAYSGVGLHIRCDAFADEPLFSHPAFDFETRIVTAQIGDLIFVSVYVPNGGKDFPAKMEFLRQVEAFIGDAHARGHARRPVRRYQYRARRTRRSPQRAQSRADRAAPRGKRTT